MGKEVLFILLYPYRLMGAHTKMIGGKLSHEKKILLVDNETDVTYAISSVLEDNGFLVDSYNDPVVVSNTYKSNYYDLVILDIKMPKMDGFQLYENLRKKDQKTKICFLTASEMFYESLRKLEIFLVM